MKTPKQRLSDLKKELAKCEAAIVADSCAVRELKQQASMREGQIRLNVDAIKVIRAEIAELGGAK